MATLSTDLLDRPLVVPVEYLLTAADLAALPEELPSGPVRYELDNGRLIMMTPAGEPHANAQASIIAELIIQGERRGYGKAYGEVGVILWKSPFRVVEPDAAFVMKESLPVKTSPERYLETIPELAVEVRSKNDSKPYMARKVDDYLAAGVQMVWVVDPEETNVTVYRPGKSSQILTAEGTLECDDIIPGFSLKLATIFHG